VKQGRLQWALAGPWKIKRETDIDRPMLSFTEAHFDDSGWQEIPPATHLQPWLYPDNPYWGEQIREINDAAWWYRIRFSLPQEAQDKRIRIYFKGVDYCAQAWCNGQHLGQHEGGFVPFWFDVTEAIRAHPDRDEHVLVVQVTAPWDPDNKSALTYVDQVHRGMVKGLYAHNDGLIPPDVNPIGIWRPVWLQAIEDVTIERLSTEVVEDEYDHSAQLTIHLHVKSRRPEPVSGILHVYLAGETFKGVRADDHYAVEILPGDHIITQPIRIPDPHWWWPWDMGRPDLYRLECTLYDDQQELDACEQVLGLREVELLRTRETLHYQINGRLTFLRGTTYMGGLYLSQLTTEQIYQDLERVRECGLNLIRLHVHVAPPEVYAACDQLGIAIWQDFELNWLHDPSPEFEQRAVGLCREMMAYLGNYASIITWCGHNEPTALPFIDVNLREHPDRALYREMATDRSRPHFICSGKQEQDWRRSGDTHAYIGGGHGGHYAEVYGRRSRLVTEFGCESLPDEATLDEHPMLARRLDHARPRLADIQAYQAALIKYQIEWYRMTRFAPCGGYIQFMFVDLYPQVGCGVLDAARRPRPSFEALKTASQPVHVMLEYTSAGPKAIWVANDLARPLPNALIEWQIRDKTDQIVTRGSAQSDIPAQRAHRVALLSSQIDPSKAYTISLTLSRGGEQIDANCYRDPFRMPPRPQDYPWHFDPVLGMRCYGGPHAQSSLAVLNTWYGKLARALFPVYDWAEEMLRGAKIPPLFERLLQRFFAG
jgi:beta-mannosidase